MTKKLFLLTFLWTTLLGTQAQNVQTILDTTFEVDDAIILDKAGNLYGSNFDGDAVYKLTPNGQISVFANGFNTPNGLAFDSQENLFVVDPVGNSIYKVDKSGNHTDTISFTGASGIIKSWDSDTMIVSSYFGHRISKLSPDGVLTPWLQGAPLNGPVGFTYDDQNNLYVGNFNDREIYRLDSDSIVYIATVPGRANGTGALGFITYSHGLIYGTSYNTHKIYRVYPTYTDSVEWFAGSVAGAIDGPVSQALFHSPNGIYASITGDTIYVSDYTPGRVRMIVNAGLGAPEFSTQKLKVSVYPNPARYHVSVELNKPSTSASIIRVFSVLGELEYETVEAAGLTQHTFEINEWPNGVYMLQIESQNSYYSKKIIKH